MEKRIKYSKLGLILAGLYLALYATMAGLALYILITDPAHSEFSALGLVAVTSPWSIKWISLINGLGIIHWYERFAGSPAGYGALFSLILFPAALPYTLFAYTIGWMIEHSWRGCKPHP